MRFVGVLYLHGQNNLRPINKHNSQQVVMDKFQVILIYLFVTGDGGQCQYNQNDQQNRREMDKTRNGQVNVHSVDAKVQHPCKCSTCRQKGKGSLSIKRHVSKGQKVLIS